ncbi:MAG: hypothetical protein ACR2QW_05665 [bacterium]
MIKKQLLFTFGLLIILSSNLSIAAVSGQGDGQFHEGYFGIIEFNHNGEAEFVITDRVPLIEGQFYGWVIKIGPQFAKIKWKEVLELPEAPESWGVEETSGDLVISEDRKVSVMQEEVYVEDGYIANYWNVLAGDPPGDYIMRVYVNDHLVETFRFKVTKN